MAKKVRKAVIPAAGLGTRFLPASKVVPKELMPIVDVPSIQVVVEEAVAAGIREVVLITGPTKSLIEDHFRASPEFEALLRKRGKPELAEQLHRISELVTIKTAVQTEALGLGHAVLCAREAVGDEPFAVLLPDDLFDGSTRPGIGQLVDVYEETGLSAVGVMEVPKEDVKLYGIVGGDDAGKGRLRAKEVVEKPDPAKAPSRKAIVGRYVLAPEVFAILEKTRAGVGGEIQLTDGLLGLAKGPGLLAVTLEGNRYDAGTRLGFIEANLAYALKRKDIGADVQALLRKLSQ